MKIHETITTTVIISEATLKAIALIIQNMKETDKYDNEKLNLIPAWESLKEKKGIKCECYLWYSYNEEENPNSFNTQILPPRTESTTKWTYQALSIPQEAFFLIKNEVTEKFAPPIEMWLKSLEE